MTLQDLISGAWGAGGASIVGAFVVLFLKRLIFQYDQKNKEFEDKITTLTNILQDLKISIVQINTEVAHLNKSLDKMERGLHE